MNDEWKLILGVGLVVCSLVVLGLFGQWYKQPVVNLFVAHETISL